MCEIIIITSANHTGIRGYHKNGGASQELKDLLGTHPESGQFCYLQKLSTITSVLNGSYFGLAVVRKSKGSQHQLQVMVGIFSILSRINCHEGHET